MKRLLYIFRTKFAALGINLNLFQNKNIRKNFLAQENRTFKKYNLRCSRQAR